MILLPEILGGADVDAQISRIRLAIAQLDHMDAASVVDATDRAGKFRQIAKAMKANDALMRECIVFEIHALRAVGLLGAEMMLPAAQRSAATALTDVAVFEAVQEHIGQSASALGAYRAYIKGIRDREMDDRVDDWRLGRGREAPEADERDIQDYRDAAAMLLEQIDIEDDGRPIQIDRLTNRLRSEMGFHRPWTDVESTAIKDIVRDALVADACLDDDGHQRPDGLPRYVTWQWDGEWFRIPVAAATIEQLEWMLRYRRTQVEQIQAKADRLETAIDELKETQQRYPKAILVRDILSKFRYQKKRAAA